MVREGLKTLDKTLDPHVFLSPVEETLKIFMIMGWGSETENFKTMEEH